MKEFLKKLGLCSSLFGGSLTLEHISALRQSGIKYLEISNPAKYPLSTAATSHLQNGEIKVNSVHAPYSKEIDISLLDETARMRSLATVKGALEHLLRVEGEMLVVHASSEPIADEMRSARLRQCKRSLQEIVEACSSVRKKLAVEILPRTCLGNSTVEMLDLIREFDPAIVGVCLDANHVNLTEDLAEAVNRIGERLFTLHISDNDGVDERHLFPFDGVIEWRPFLLALADCGYAGAFMYEVRAYTVHPQKAIKRVKRNFAKIQSLINEPDGRTP